MSVDLGDQPMIVYKDIPLEIVEEFVQRGHIAKSYRFGSEVLDLMRRNPEARLGAMVACSWDEGVGWYAVVRCV